MTIPVLPGKIVRIVDGALIEQGLIDPDAGLLGDRLVLVSDGMGGLIADWSATSSSSSIGFLTTHRALGRQSAGAGAGEEVTIEQMLEWLVGTAARGDIIYRDATGWVRKPLGTAGQRLKSNGTDLVYFDDFFTIPVMVDGGGTTIVSGYKGVVAIDTPGTIVEAKMLSADNLTGSIVMDLWKSTYAGHSPTVANTITASAKPTIVAGTKTTNTTLTGWTLGLAAGDELAINVDSVSSFQRVLLSLKVKKS